MNDDATRGHDPDDDDAPRREDLGPCDRPGLFEREARWGRGRVRREERQR